jgi:hypothetical protein
MTEKYTWQQVLKGLQLDATLKHTTRNPEGVLKRLCVFHRENTPSLVFWNRSLRFKCHGCCIEGTAQEFVLGYGKVVQRENRRYRDFVLTLPTNFRVPASEHRIPSSLFNARIAALFFA